MSRLSHLQDFSRTRAQLQGHPLARKLIARSQYLGKLGISVEIRWLPGRRNNLGGNRLAHMGARAAAKGTIIVVPEEVAVQITLPPLVPHDSPVLSTGSVELQSDPDSSPSSAPSTDEK